MSAPGYLWMFGAGALLPVVCTPLIMRELARQQRIDARFAQVRRGASSGGVSAAIKAESPDSLFIAVASALGDILIRSGIISQKTIIELQETLANTRLPGLRGLSIFIGIKLLLIVGCPAVVVVLGGQTGMASGTLFSLAAIGGVLGLLAPDYVLRRIRRGYLKQVEAGLADALDLLVICAEAGLGLEPAIERVSTEIAVAHPAVANELLRTSQDMRMIADRKVALTNMGQRTGLESLERLALTLVQSMQLGTPLARALRTIAAELRQEALTRFEARAARLPVLLTLPMIIFILPCVFIVVAGPAGIQVFKQLSH